MLCDFCHEHDAVIFLEQVSNNGQKRRINICRDCALKRGISSDPKSVELSIGDLFRELADMSKKFIIDNSRMCPVCGTSISEIRKTGLVGCPECYSVFKNDIKKLLADKGIAAAYTGSMPRRLASVHSVLTDRIMLQNKLDAAVAKEDYEKAAMYRDYLRALEQNPVYGAGEEC